MRRAAAFGMLVLLVAQAVEADPAVMRNLTVDREEGAYQVRFEAVVDVPPDRVFALLTDYDRLNRLNPGIVVAKRLEADSAVGDRVRTVLEGCVLFFCRRMERVEIIQTSNQRLITTRMVPEASDFRSGKTRWQLAAVAEGTRVRFRGRMVPDFWVPPVVGSWAIESDLRANMRTLVRRLERYGRSEEGR